MLESPVQPSEVSGVPTAGAVPPLPSKSSERIVVSAYAGHTNARTTNAPNNVFISCTPKNKSFDRFRVAGNTPAIMSRCNGHLLTHRSRTFFLNLAASSQRPLRRRPAWQCGTPQTRTTTVGAIVVLSLLGVAVQLPPQHHVPASARRLPPFAISVYGRKTSCSSYYLKGHPCPFVRFSRPATVPAEGRRK